jgi:uncharacterized protein YjiS (DUF1127 family)
VNTQKQANPLSRRPVEAGETLCDIHPRSAIASIVLPPADREPMPISLLKILHRFRTDYRLAIERYRQRKQLMEMDDRQLKDIGITPEQAEQEARKPIWKE